ncbi:GNAT family N-acetyltransferase [Bacillus sp. SH5-2]|uniref:GNAT family N-acetyltransferase n=1 Tax=Bacillus sp. SH5-2 TaxID=2217834 RepID=UPI0011EE53AC|nr:GNAT family N-acetyltransferase [Bacillus sp. SH5-2]KAA0760312.1 GNAT family N-acetyltransferase [Bacillus sp. SH5-2]
MKFVSIERDEILIHNIANLYCKAFEKTNFNEMIERVKRHIEYEDFKGIVAINDENEVVGFTYGYRSLEGQYYNQLMREALHLEQVNEWLQDCFEFVELAVHPKYQKEGLGTKLHNRLLDGISNRTSVLTTQINNVKARSLYERLDWVNILDPFYPSKDDVPCVIMGKVLKTKVIGL